VPRHVLVPRWIWAQTGLPKNGLKSPFATWVPQGRPSSTGQDRSGPECLLRTSEAKRERGDRCRNSSVGASVLRRSSNMVATGWAGLCPDEPKRFLSVLHADATAIRLRQSRVSESEGHTQHGSIEFKILQELLAALIIRQISVHQTDLTPVERVARTGCRLPCQVAVTRADIEVIG